MAAELLPSRMKMVQTEIKLSSNTGNYLYSKHIKCN